MRWLTLSLVLFCIPSTATALTNVDVARVINMAPDCYEAIDPKKLDTLWVSFVIQENGEVRSAEIKTSAFDSTPIGLCLLEVVQDFKFPSVKRPVKINYPFILSKIFYENLIHFTKADAIFWYVQEPKKIIQRGSGRSTWFIEPGSKRNVLLNRSFVQYLEGNPASFTFTEGKVTFKLQPPTATQLAALEEAVFAQYIPYYEDLHKPFSGREFCCDGYMFPADFWSTKLDCTYRGGICGKQP